MKLSDLTTDETLDVLCEITPCVERIVKDEGIISAIGKAQDTKGLTKTGILMVCRSEERRVGKECGS